jgi:hypothetical protein
MFWSLVLGAVLCTGQAPASDGEVSVALDAIVNVPKLAADADLRYIVLDWEKAARLYLQVVEANPTVGLY